MSEPRATAPTPADLLRRARLRWLRGDRPYLVALLATVGFALLLVSGPIQTWLGQRQLVEQTAAQLDAYEAENEALADRVDDLHDPATIEEQAREEQGMVRPGEVPYVLLPPAVDGQRIAPDLQDVRTEDRSWFTRVWGALTELFE